MAFKVAKIPRLQTMVSALAMNNCMADSTSPVFIRLLSKFSATLWHMATIVAYFSKKRLFPSVSALVD